MTYRPDIDGLRALAVLPVVFFHAGMWPFTGGFVGVDIFFVISGYLITGIIISGVAEGSFSLLGFYRRRLLRIAPAAVAMALTTVVVGMIVLPPAELRLLGNSLIAAIASLANVYFWGSAGYFDAASESKPLLHLWSLSVEEQFYLLFPIVLVALHRWGKTTAFWGIALLALCSLAWSQHAALTDPAAAFYSLQSRAFELLIGSLLAMGRTNNNSKAGRCRRGSLGADSRGSRRVRIPEMDAVSWPGGSDPLCGHGPSLVGWRRTPGNAVSRLLGTRPLRSIGLISYSLYLWHWPILVFYAIIVDRALLPSEVAVAITAALLASLLSWRF